MPNSIEFKPHVHHDRHPDLRGRKQIVARLLIARNLQALPTLRTGKRRKLFRDALKSAEVVANSDRLEKSESLHEFVKGVLDEACQHPPANAGAAG